MSTDKHDPARGEDASAMAAQAPLRDPVSEAQATTEHIERTGAAPTTPPDLDGLLRDLETASAQIDYEGQLGTRESTDRANAAYVAARRTLVAAFRSFSGERDRAEEDADKWLHEAEDQRARASASEKARADLAGRLATETAERERCRDGWAKEHGELAEAVAALVKERDARMASEEARDRAERDGNEARAAIDKERGARESAEARLRSCLGEYHDQLARAEKAEAALAADQALAADRCVCGHGKVNHKACFFGGHRIHDAACFASTPGGGRMCTCNEFRALTPTSTPTEADDDRR